VNRLACDQEIEESRFGDLGGLKESRVRVSVTRHANFRPEVPSRALGYMMKLPVSSRARIRALIAIAMESHTGSRERERITRPISSFADKFARACHRAEGQFASFSRKKEIIEFKKINNSK